MSNIFGTQQSDLYRLWSVPLLLVGLYQLVAGLNDNTLYLVLFGAGMLLMAIFAFRYNLLDISPKALNPSHLGGVSTTLLAAGVLLVLAAVAVRLIV